MIRLLTLASVLLLHFHVLAQQVRVTNFGQSTYSGWVRATVDSDLPHPSGVTPSGVEWHVGRHAGLESRVVDLRMDLPAGQSQVVTFPDASDPGERPLAIDWLAEQERVGGPKFQGYPIPLARTSVGGRNNPLQDGAGSVIHWAGRPLGARNLLHADLWLTYYPDQPWAVGEIVLCAGHPGVENTQTTMPEGGLKFEWPGAVVVVDGLGIGQPILPQGEWLVTGQARSFRFVVGWLDRMDIGQVHSALVASAHGVVANGLESPGALGVAASPDGYDASAWVRKHWPRARSRLHEWATGNEIGVAANSGQTGAQEDQGFGKGSRAYAPGGRGVEVVRYYTALGQSRRMCHHIEADGTHLDLTGHPGLVLWSGIPHWHTGVSPDRLGKPTWDRLPSHGWSGTDREHWFANTVAFAAEVTASPALQWQLEHHVALFWFGETVDPRLSTSGADAARSQGWAGIMATHLWHCLEDRTKAALVRQRFTERVTRVYLPRWTSPPQLWDMQTDRRVTQYLDTDQFPRAFMGYQAGFATMGIEIAARTFGLDEARQAAYEQAKKVVDHCWTTDLVDYEIVGIRDSGALATHLVEGVSAHRTGWYREAWLPCAAWVVLQHEPQNERARAIYARAVEGREPNDWMPPR